MYLGATIPSIPPATPAGSGCDTQIPERSGLPSGVRGTGADRFGRPSAVRGIFGLGSLGHCAPAGSDVATTTIAIADNIARFRQLVLIAVIDTVLMFTALRGGSACSGRAAPLRSGRPDCASTSDSLTPAPRGVRALDWCRLTMEVLLLLLLPFAFTRRNR